MAAVGSDHRLEAGDYVAHVASVGASLRSLTFRGRDLVLPYAADEVRPYYRGAILAPWPNRVVDAKYTFNGALHLLDVTEPERGHALHGLVAWSDFSVVSQAPDRLELGTSLQAPRGYPHHLEVRVEYRLGADGLSTRVRGANVGDTVAPFGASGHPYLVAGEGGVDDWELTLHARRVMTVSARLAPIGVVDVDDPAHGDFDFRRPRSLDGVFIDHAFTDLDFGADGRARATVISRDGSGVQMTWDTACPWLQVHTADLWDVAQTRRGLAVEPMTCPPNAFNSGQDLLRLAPGDDASAGWMISGID